MIPDGTLGGYLEKHGRPPAFEGSDGQSYSVDVYLGDDGDAASPMSGALLFVRWSTDGSQPVGHLETEYLVSGDERQDVRSRLLALSLQEIKDHLDRAIEHAKGIPEW